jgi:hypothetical protein
MLAENATSSLYYSWIKEKAQPFGPRSEWARMFKVPGSKFKETGVSSTVEP